MVWDSNASTLMFNLASPEQEDSTLTILLPILHAEKSLSAVHVGDVTTPINARLVLGGVEYAQVILSAQEHKIEAVYS